MEERDRARLPGPDETELRPAETEVIVIVAFFDAGLWMPPTLFIGKVLRIYGLELAQLTPNAIVRLTIFTWAI